MVTAAPAPSRSAFDPPAELVVVAVEPSPSRTARPRRAGTGRAVESHQPSVVDPVALEGGPEVGDRVLSFVCPCGNRAWFERQVPGELRVGHRAHAPDRPSRAAPPVPSAPRPEVAVLPVAVEEGLRRAAHGAHERVDVRWRSPSDTSATHVRRAPARANRAQPSSAIRGTASGQPRRCFGRHPPRSERAPAALERQELGGALRRPRTSADSVGQVVEQLAVVRRATSGSSPSGTRCSPTSRRRSAPPQPLRPRPAAAPTTAWSMSGRHGVQQSRCPHLDRPAPEVAEAGASSSRGQGAAA